MSKKILNTVLDKRALKHQLWYVYNRKTASMLKDLLNYVLHPLFPVKCVGCGKEYAYLCYECANKIELIRTDTCPKCGKISPNSRLCKTCQSSRKFHFNAVFVGSRYDSGPIKEMLYLFKYEGITALCEVLSEVAAQRVKNRINPDVVVVPVPISGSRFKKRGYNQSEFLARQISKTLKLSGGNALIRVRDTKSQVGLSKEERAENVKDSFECVDKRLVKGQEVLLIDDVATTFATLNECAKVLKGAGAKSVTGLVVAKRS